MEKYIQFYDKKAITNDRYPIIIYLDPSETGDDSIKPQWHSPMELRYVLSGEMDITIDQKSYIVKQGDLVIIRPNEYHRSQSLKRSESVVIMFDFKKIAIEDLEENVVLKRVISGDEMIQNIFSRIYREHRNREVGHKMVCKGLLLYMMTHLLRNHTEYILTDEEKLKAQRKRDRLYGVCRYIDEHYFVQISSKELAESMCISEGRFQHLFKECMGISVQQYINNIRMKKAMQMLQETTLRSSEIAEMVGFMDYNSFGKMFRRTYGKTPSQVRREKIDKSEKLQD
jgi:AraC-like DNA-binding protein